VPRIIGARAVAVLLPMLAALTLAPVRVATAQDAFDAKAAGHLREQYLADMDSVHAKFIALAKAIPAEKYSWRPGAGVRSVSEVLMHIVGEWYFYGPRSVGGKEPADFGAPKTSCPPSRRLRPRRLSSRS
jgi:hypothetical protein